VTKETMRELQVDVSFGYSTDLAGEQRLQGES